MPKKPKHDEQPPDPKGNWAEDQKEHEYYYDDAHGYEEFDPEADEEDSETGREGEGESASQSTE